MSASATRANPRYPQLVARMNPVSTAARTPNIRRARSIVIPTPAIPDSAAGSTAVSSVTWPPGTDSAAMAQMNSGVFCIRTSPLIRGTSQSPVSSIVRARIA